MKWLKQLEMTSEHHVTFEQHVLDELEPFAQEVDSYSGEEAFSIDKLLYRLTSNPMCAIVFGRRYVCTCACTPIVMLTTPVLWLVLAQPMVRKNVP